MKLGRCDKYSPNRVICYYVSMLDKIVGKYSIVKNRTVNVNYTPVDAITSSKITNPGGAYLTVLFPPWHGGVAVYDKLTRRLVKNGSAVLAYKFHGQILQPDVQMVIKSYEHIQKTVTNKIHELVEKYSYQYVDLTACSLGNVALLLVASTYPDFRKATLIVSGSTLARDMWEGSRTGIIRQQFEATGITESMLSKAWANLAPSSHVAALAGKEVTMYISGTDKVIPARYQQEMADAVLAVNPKTRVYVYARGHVASVAGYGLHGKL
ncbi:MAG: hypothetical protein JWM81_10 [Candidatus Saccharibacteria bacterium]|nr:hypothetical protein [Candidatus Saccharibacteria bacterium]